MDGQTIGNGLSVGFDRFYCRGILAARFGFRARRERPGAGSPSMDGRLLPWAGLAALTRCSRDLFCPGTRARPPVVPQAEVTRWLPTAGPTLVSALNAQPAQRLRSQDSPWPRLHALLPGYGGSPTMHRLAPAVAPPLARQSDPPGISLPEHKTVYMSAPTARVNRRGCFIGREELGDHVSPPVLS